MNNPDDFLVMQRITINECSELYEMSRQTEGWATEYKQLGAGKFETSFDLYASSSLRLSEQYSNREMSISGIPPDGHVALVLPLNRGDKGVFQGCEFGANDVGLMIDGSEYFFRSPQNLRMIVVTIPVSRFGQALCAAEHGKELHQVIAGLL